MTQIRPNNFWCVGALLGAVLMATAQSEEPARQPVELGSVAWMRDFDKAQSLAVKQSRPLLVLFQEVPG